MKSSNRDKDESLKAFQLLSLIVIINTIVACAEVPKDAPHYLRLTAIDEKKANIYIYRTNAKPTKKTPIVLIDNRPIFEPPEGSYTVVQLDSGTHHVLIDWPWDINVNRQFPILVQKGIPLYIKITGSFFAQVLSEEEAESEIKNCCRYIPQKNTL